MRMKAQLSIAIVLMTLAAGVAQNTITGLRPHAKASEYPAVRYENNLIVGAAQLSGRQVRNSFVSELNGHYIVIEVGIYPISNSKIEVLRDHFTLQAAGTNEIIRPATPATIAAVLQKKTDGGRDVALYPTVGVGHSTGRDIYGNQGPGGTVVVVGMGAEIGDSRPPSTPADRKTMETELQDKSLPEGQTNKSVAGYLYFPIASNKKQNYKLAYSNYDPPIKLDLPKPSE